MLSVEYRRESYSQTLMVCALVIFVTVGLLLIPSFVSVESQGVRDDILVGNYKRAYKKALTGARLGDKKAANSLANLYYLGLGVDQDYQQAACWYLKAALAGYSPAQANLGHLYSQGLGVPKDLMRTLGWYRLAKLGGYRDVEDIMRRKIAENQFNATIIVRANELFENLNIAKRSLSKHLKLIKCN